MILTHASPRRVVGTDAAGRTLSCRLARIRLTVSKDARFSRNIAVHVRRAPRCYNRKVKTKMSQGNIQVQSKLNLDILIVFIFLEKEVSPDLTSDSFQEIFIKFVSSHSFF